MPVPSYLTFSVSAFHYDGNVCGGFFIHMHDAQDNNLKAFTAHVYASPDPALDPGTVSSATLASVAINMAQALVVALGAAGHDIQIRDCLTAAELDVRIAQVMEFQRQNGLAAGPAPVAAVNRSIAR